MATPDVYRRLRQHLDRMPVGFPRTESGVELRLLERLFTPAEAEIVLELSAIPEPVSAVQRRLEGFDTEDALARVLDDLAGRGLILRVETPSGVRYGKLPWAVGIYERQLPRLTEALERESRQYGEEAFGAAFHSRKTTQMRTVPVSVSIGPDRQVATYDDIRAYVRASDGPFAAMPCICRHGRDLVGESCHQTKVRENCLTLGIAATGMVENGAARFVTRDEMLALLDEADREGLVLQPENTQHPLFVCCCCGCCCGVLTTAKRLPAPADFFSTNFVAEVDAATCEACGTCLTRCQMDALSLESGKAEVRRTHCIGCGLCITTCQSGALALRDRPSPRVPPRDTAALYARMYQDRFGLVGLATAAVRHFVGLKV